MPSATTANTLPWTSPPMTICAACSTMPRRAPSSGQRRAARLAHRVPVLALDVPARHHGVADGEAALRLGGEVVEPVDARLALELRQVVAQLHRGDRGPELAQRAEHHHAGPPA